MVPDWKLIAIGSCNDGVAPDFLGRLLDFGFVGFVLGAIVSLVMSVFVLQGARRNLSMVMLGILAVLFWAVFFLAPVTSERTLLLAVESLWLIGLATFGYLGVLSVVDWPTRDTLVNLPLVVGTHITWGAVVLHEFASYFCPSTGWQSVSPDLTKPSRDEEHT